MSISVMKVYRLVDDGTLTPEEGATVLFAADRERRAERLSFWTLALTLAVIWFEAGREIWTVLR